jgi:predicted alpha/beta hydrolase
MTRDGDEYEGDGRWGAGRGITPSPPRGEEIELRTRDGASLRVVVTEPEPGRPLRGTFVLAHAIFARGSSLGRSKRPGLADVVRDAGYRTAVLDFRGHGASKSPRPWRYDDLVANDVPAVVEMARARFGGGPVLVAGHSLGGHVALAAQGTGRMHADGFLVVGANVWLPEIEPSRARRIVKELVARAATPIVSLLRDVPMRRLGLGSDDAPADVVRDFLATSLGRAWASDDGEDYFASLGRVDVPVCAVVSERDLLLCTPGSGAAFARRCGGRVEIVTVTESDDGGPPPGHMELATTLRARCSLERAIAWLDARTHVGEG